MTEYKIPIPCRIYNASGGNVCGTDDVIDDVKGKKQSQINTEVYTAIQNEIERATEAENDRYTKTEVYKKEETYNKNELNNLITTPNQEYVTVVATNQTTAATDVLPATGSADTIYRVGNWDGSQYSEVDYTEYAWNGSAYIKLDTKSQIGEVYDISANHADTKYANLSAALGTNGANIPVSLRKGGMSVKFVLTSDNNYVQFRLKPDEFSTDVDDWEQSASVTQLEELEDNVVMIGSYDATVAVGLADNLRGDTIVDAEFYKRKTGGTQSVGSGIAAIKEVRGKSIVWNQLCPANIVCNSTTLYSAQVNGRKATLTIIKKGSASSIINIGLNITKKVGHKYLICYNITHIGDDVILIANGFSGWNTDKQLNINPNEQYNVGYIVANNGTNAGAQNGLYCYYARGSHTPDIGDIIEIEIGNIIDLTLMFGAGNEPATVEEFNKMFPLNYYDYNAGEVIPFAGQNLTTIGKNQYNPATGKANLLGGQTYQISGTYTKLYPTVTLIDYTYGNTVTAGTYYANDSNHFVGAKNVETYDNTATYALGKYCTYNNTIYKSNVAIETAEEFDATHWDIIADVAAMVSEGIFTLWDIVPDANGLFTLTKDTEVTIVGGNNTDTIVAIYNGESSAYEPYEKHTLPLDPSQWRDKQGNLVFPYGGMFGYGSAYDYAKVGADGYIRKAMRVYERRAYESGDVTSGNIITDGSTYTFYPLAEPIEVELATPVYAKYLCDKDGTEEITPANGTTPYTTMANLSILYAMDARGEIKNLPKNYLSKESAENMLNAMVSAGVIASYTMTWDAANSRYVFTIVAPV